jgi:hypothetical protein
MHYSEIDSECVGALLPALPVTFGVMGLMFYWFAHANRAVVFLYDHNMGPLVADTSAFSLMTRSRYWMTGLVASGMVLFVYTPVVWTPGRWRSGYVPPTWRQVWLWFAVPLTLGIPLITITANMSVLPAVDALLTTAVTLAGLAFALAAGELAATAPRRFG